MTSTRRQFLQSTAALGLGSLCSSAAPVRSERPQDLAALPQSLPQGAFRRLGSNRFLAKGPIYKAVFSKDDKYLLTASENYLDVFEANTGICKFSMLNCLNPRVNFCEFKVENDRATVVGIARHEKDGRSLLHLDFQSKQQTTLWNIKAPFGEPTFVDIRARMVYSFNSFTSSLTADSPDYPERLWDCDERWSSIDTPRISFEAHCIAFRSNNGLCLVDSRTGKRLALLKITPQVRCTTVLKSLSPDGNIIIAYDVNKKETYAYDISRQKILWKQEQDSDAVHFLPDGKSLIAINGIDLKQFDAKTGKVLQSMKCSDSSILAISHDGKSVAMPTWQCAGVKLFDLTTGKFQTHSAEAFGSISQIRFPDSTRVVAVMDYNFRAWTIQGQPLDYLYSSESGVPMYCESLSPDGCLQAEISDEGELRLKETKGGKTRITVNLEEKAQDDSYKGAKLLWAMGGTRVLVVTDKQFIQYDVKSRKVFQRQQFAKIGEGFIHDDTVMAIHLSANCTQATVEFSRLESETFPYVNFDLRTGAITTFSLPLVNSIAFSNDRHMVAFNTIVKNEWTDGLEAHLLVVPTSNLGNGSLHLYRELMVFGCGFKTQANLSPDGCSLLVAVEMEYEVENFFQVTYKETKLGWELYESLTGKIRFRGVTTSTMTHAAFSPDGRTIATAHPDAPIFLWDLYGERTSPQREPDARSLPKLWGDLESYDAELAFKAIRTFVQHPVIALKFLGERLHDIRKWTREEVVQDIESLGYADYRTRDAAQKRLTASVDVVRPILLESQKRSDLNFEAQSRIESILKAAEGISASSIRIHRCIEILGHIRTTETKALLVKLSAGSGLLAREATRLVKSWE